MKVLFLQPPMGGWVTWGKHIAINVNHAQLAANLREWYPDIDIHVLDCRALNIDEEGMLSSINEIKPELVYMGDALQTTGVAAIHPRYKRAAELIKDKLPATKICVGGFYYGANAQKFLEETESYDFVISGETEVTMPELAKELSKKDPNIASVNGLAYKDNGSVKLTEYRPLYKNLDDLPLPAYDLFPMDKYVGFSYIKKYVETYHSRGCPNGCTFCVGWTNYDKRGKNDWQKYRIRSGKKVADEFELLIKNYGAKFICIMDEDFNVYRSRVEEFIMEMKKRNLKVPFFFMGRAPYHLRDKDLLKPLREIGFVCGLIGLEAVDEDTLKKIHKNVEVDQVAETINLFRENNIMSVVTWMVGYPDDDETKIKERFERIDMIDPDMSALQIMTPLPGIPIYDELKQYIKDWDLSKWDFQHAVVSTKYLSKEDLGRLAAWANREFYSKPGRVQRVLYNKNYHPTCRLIARCYVETADKHAQAAIKDEIFV
ncbi:MAG: radical SAM protein [Deferribacterota bacterium]|nr:radical SAM protein [Deferribacterota bacterium]